MLRTGRQLVAHDAGSIPKEVRYESRPAFTLLDSGSCDGLANSKLRKRKRSTASIHHPYPDHDQQWPRCSVRGDRHVFGDADHCNSAAGGLDERPHGAPATDLQLHAEHTAVRGELHCVGTASSSSCGLCAPGSERSDERDKQDSSDCRSYGRLPCSRKVRAVS